MAAGVLFPPKLKDQGGHPLADLRIHGSGYGATFPQIYGRHRISGNVIDSTDLVAHRRPGGRSGGNLNATQKNYYTCNVDVAVCKGPITSIDRIWAESILIYDASLTPPTTYNIRIYLGDETQLPDSLFQSIHGAGNTPAYRGVAHVVFDTFDCSYWGNRFPSMNFEVVHVLPYDEIILADGPRVYYSFDLDTGRFTDQGPSGYTLSQSSGTTLSIGGHANEGVQLIGPFPGTTDGVLRSQTGAVADLEPTAFSVEGWFQYQGSIAVGTGVQFEYLNPNTGERAWKLWAIPNIFTEETYLQFRVYTLASGVTDIFSHAVTRDAPLWHYLAVTYDTTGDAILYYDGAELERTPAPVAPVTITADSANRLQVTGGDYHWDELAYYNRALTPLEVYNHYQGKGSTVGTILAQLFAQCGLSPSQYDVSAATDYVQGFLIHTRQDCRTQIMELLRLYDTDLCERDGKIVALKRGGAPLFMVPAADLGAHVTTGAETDPPVKVTVKRLPELELPQRLDLRYYDRTSDYQQGLQGASRPTKAPEVQEALTLQTTFVLHPDEARQKAEKELWRQWTEREQYTFSLGPAYLQAAPGDVLLVPAAGSTRRVRIIGQDMGLLGPLTFQGVLDDASLLTQTAAGQAVTAATQLPIATSTTLVAWNSDALRDQEANGIGYYVAAGAPTGHDWPGAGLYQSLDSGGSYQRVANLTDSADMGAAVSVLSPNTPGDAWDTVNTVDVAITSGDPPLTTSDGDVLAGANAALLGTEVIQYATVTPMGGNVYRLSRLLRGRRGTEVHVGEHQSGETFVLLSDQTVTHYPLALSLAGKSVLLKAVTLGQTLSSVTPVSVYIEGAELKPYSVVQLAGSRNIGLDLTVTWIPRARANQEMHDSSDIALTDLPESYTVGILAGSPAAITAITNDAAHALVTAPGHGFADGQTVYFSGIQGMTQISGLQGVVSAVTTNTFVVALVTTGMGVFLATGSPRVEKIVRQIGVSSPTASYSAAQQTSDGFTPGNPVRLVVWQNGALGRGAAAFAAL